jgi:1-acyl-sn-glycerol-3-phosphate acyltransferase
MRKFDFQKKFLYLLETIKFTVAQDQDYLNRLCKGRTKIISVAWDRMPIPTTKIEEDDVKIIHYNLIYKPYHFDNVLYENYFWKYAEKTEFSKEILEMKKQYTEEERFRDLKQYEDLKQLAKKENDCVGDDRRFLKDGINEKKLKERIKVLKKIEELEKSGVFDVDAEDDPPTTTLLPGDVDYLNHKSTSKIKNKIAYRVVERFVDDLVKENKLIIKEIRGIENLQNVSTGAVLTCNHFNPFDSFAVEKVFRESGQYKKKKLYKVIREGNYTNFPGLYGFFFRNCDTLPLSSNMRTMIEFMKAVDTILQRKDFILIYPEQSMWWNYRKPKPLKEGAYRFAVKNNVPIIPFFITTKETDILDESGFPNLEYYIHIEKPIYPESSLSLKENIAKMREANFRIWKEIYEKFYGTKLQYNCNYEKLPDYILNIINEK